MRKLLTTILAGPFITSMGMAQGGCLGVEPTAVGSLGQALPALVCQHEVLTLDGSGSQAAGGASIVDYAWDLGGGNIVHGASVAQPFDDPGAYPVQLMVTDDQGCTSINPVELLVLVSTTPTFAGTTAGQNVCAGEIVDLAAVVSPTGWATSSTTAIDSAAYIPDNPGTPLNSTMSISAFDAGQVLTDIADLLSVCVEMEHSYMSDLIITIICPNGQSVIMHQQGGGGTFIGQALDGETVPPTMGVCWEYCWTPTTTNGTWVDSSGTSPLPAGIYASVQPMHNLVGCPMNGDWTLSISDQAGADDGFLCGWHIDFNPAFYEGVVSFTPTLGTNSPDSAYWSGSGFVADPGNPLNGTATPTATGANAYVFTIMDNFGCAYDTTIVLHVPNLQLDAVSGPGSVPAGETAMFIASPVLPDADLIIWDPLPAGWSWQDPIHTDAEAFLVAPAEIGPATICATAFGDGCYGNTVCLTTSIVVGVQDLGPNGDDLSIFPNPGTGAITVRCATCTGPVDLRVLDPLGRVVRSLRINNEIAVLDFADLPSGTYWLKWTLRDRSRWKPLVIER
ncbi:MAG: PKD domain-containing protein [Flavobacteriales bacterium]